MKTKKLYAAILFLGVVSSAFAAKGGREGHGGQVLACFASKKTADSVAERLRYNRTHTPLIDPLTPQALKELQDPTVCPGVCKVVLIDFDLARREGLEEAEPLVESEGRTFKQIIDERWQKLAATNSILLKEIEKSANLIALKKWVRSDSFVLELDDAMLSGMKFNENCLPLQIAYQEIPEQVALTRVIYDERLFKLLPPVDQAGLVYHEWIYNRMVEHLQAKDARSTQLLTKLMFQKRFGPTMGFEFHQTLESLGFYAAYRTPFALQCSPIGCTYTVQRLAHCRTDVALYDHGVFPRIHQGGVEVQVCDSSIDVGYNFHRPITYQDLTFKSLIFTRDGSFPLRGYMAARFPHPTYSKVSIDAVGFSAEGQIQWYRGRADLGEGGEIVGIRIQGSAEMTFDSEMRIVSVYSGKNFKLPGTEISCKTVGFDYVAGQRIVRSCSLSTEFVFRGLRITGGILFSDDFEFDFERTLKEMKGYDDGLYFQRLKLKWKDVTISQSAQGDFYVQSFDVSTGHWLLNQRCQGKVTAYPGERIASCFAANNTYEIGLDKFDPIPGTLLEFHENGQLKSATFKSLGREAKPKIQGRKVRVGDRLIFDQNGRLIQ